MVLTLYGTPPPPPAVKSWKAQFMHSGCLEKSVFAFSPKGYKMASYFKLLLLKLNLDV